MNKILRPTLTRLALGLGFALSLTACGSVSTRSGGLHDEAYILLSAVQDFVGQDLLLSIDQNEPLHVRPSKEGNQATRKGERIVIKPGKHHLELRQPDGRLIYDRLTVISTRSTKSIVLP